MNNVIDYILRNNQSNDRTALIDTHESVSYQDLKFKIQQACSYFQQVLLPNNNRVTVCAGDSIAFVVAALGVIAAGGILTPVSNKGDVSAKITKINPVMTLDDSTIADWYQSIQNLHLSNTVTASGPCLFLASGGTTGPSKFFIHTHDTVYHTAICLHGKIIGTKDDVSLSVVPLHAAWGTMGLIANLMIGTTVVIGGSVHPTKIKQLIEKHHVTWMSAVPAVYSLMLKHDLVPAPVPKFCVVAGDVTTEHLRKQWHKKTGQHLTHIMGTSEAGLIFAVPIGDAESCPLDSLGKCEPTTEIELRDDHGNIVPIGQPGVLWVRNKASAIGLWQDSEKEKSIFQNGWLNIEDMVKQDHNNNYFFVGRRSELFKVDAKMVDVTSVENSCLSSGLLDDVLAIPLYDKQNRTHIKLLAVPGKNTVLENLDVKLKEYLLKVLPCHEVPNYIQAVKELPRTMSGKKIRKPEFL
jgi:acyl-coenzyme A synthetase/AMP-(fatty) acid ligase